MSEDSPHITMQHGITTFECSRGALAGDSVLTQPRPRRKVLELMYLLNDSVGHGEEADEEVDQQNKQEEVSRARSPEHTLRGHFAHARSDVAEVEYDDELEEANGSQQGREEETEPHE